MFKIEFILPALIALATLISALFSYRNDKKKILYSSIALFLFALAFIAYDNFKDEGEKPLKKDDFVEAITELREDCLENSAISQEEVQNLKKEKRKLEEQLAKYAEEGVHKDIFADVKEKVERCELDNAETTMKQHYDQLDEDKAKAAFTLAGIKYLKVEYNAARQYYEEVVRLAPDNALYLNDLGNLLYHMADYKKSILYSERALAINKKKLGEDHSDVATNLNNIGSAWKALGKYKRAIGYYEKALEIDKKAFGDQHPSVARELNNIGMAWDSLGEYKKAIGFYEKALEIDKKAFGDQHPKIAIRLNNIGEAWRELSEYKKAIGFYKQALTIFRKELGNEHPNVATLLNNIGLAWDSLGEYKKALGFYQKGLKIDKKALGGQHPNVAIRLNNMALAWNSLGEYEKAIGYYEKALKIFEAKLGANHPHTKTVKGNMEFAKSMLLMQK
jgi:tetratricopeptide (TPR) repeat protein